MSQDPPSTSGVLHSGAKRASRSRASYPRKRALIACQTCRKRKSKCDNQRPVCGACQELDISCTFQDSQTDHSRYDLASLEILERINYVAELLETQRSEHLSAAPAVSSGSPADHTTCQSHTSSHFPLNDHSVIYTEANVSTLSNRTSAESPLDSLEFTGTNPGVSEDVLNWPIFGGEYDRARTESKIFNPDLANLATDQVQSTLSASHSARSSPIRTSKLGRGVREDDVLLLINKFLVNVHIKNPILDPDDLKMKGKWVVENGFGWDDLSCLVLTVCALASLSSSFVSSPVTPDIVEPAQSANSLDASEGYTTAESYYFAARKRIGLLESTISATQCHFLMGVYEMYSLRPAKAWTSFNRACITLQIYFRGQDRQEIILSKGIVSKLYWSCLKSECELRMEISLPPSGLANTAYPDVFPTPPRSVDTAEAIHEGEFGTQVRSGSSSAQQPGPDLENIWNYYLSELAVRRIGNRIMNCYYKEEESSWVKMPLDRMIRVAEELELQVTQWFDYLPSILKTSDDLESPGRLVMEELQFVLHARLFDFRERIYRPFLYLAIHQLVEGAAIVTIAPYAQRCIEACLACLLRGTPRHRHHGIWYENRGMYLKSLLMIAAVKSRIIPVPQVWRRGVDLCIAGLKYWEAEAPDLHEARWVVQELLDGIHS